MDRQQTAAEQVVSRDPRASDDAWDAQAIERRILRIRDDILATEDTVCLERARLMTEAYRRYEGEPPPLKRARAFAYVLRNMTLDLGTNPFFAGNTSTRPRAWMLVPEHGFRSDAQIVLENPQLEGLLEGRIPSDLLDFWSERSFGGGAGIGHLAVDYARVVHEGLAALVEEAEIHLHEGTADQQIYRQAMVIALQAVIDWAERYAMAAEAAAAEVCDEMTRTAYRRMAAACRRVPAYPARTLFEGLQSITLVHLAIHIEGHGLSVSIGLPDRVLAPFVDASCDAAEAKTMVAAFLLKIHANSVFGRGSKTQAITVGGADHLGIDQSNALTHAFMSAADLVRVGDPHLFLRWHSHLDVGVKRQAMRMLASGASMPLLIHDEPTAGGFVAAGVQPEDAWDYCVIGCNELGIPGRSAESATATSGTIQYLALLNEVLLEHPAPDTLRSMDQLFDLLAECLADRVPTMRLRGRAYRERVAKEMPTPFTSALMRGCVRRGRDFMIGMDYHLPCMYERGLTNAANALAAIEAVVFGDENVTMSDLMTALRANFEGAEALQARLRAAPKWGNGDECVDRWALRLVSMRERILNAVDVDMGSAPHVVCHVVRSLHYFDGKQIAASPDGRRAWTPVADSIGAETGTAQAGPTGVLNSVLTLDSGCAYRGGTNLNLTLPAAQWQTPEMEATLLSLVETFFEGGGQELQIALLDPQVLRDAQAHPERHGDLLVRVAGFNARFVDLALVEQEELIRRAEVASS